MAEGSKSGTAAQALQRHFDQDRSGHASFSGHRLGNTQDTFRSSQNHAARQQHADEQYAQEQMARMGLEDVPRSGSPAFIPGHQVPPALHPTMYQPGHQSFVPSAQQQPHFSVDEFQNHQQAGLVSNQAQSQTPTPMLAAQPPANVHGAFPQMFGQQPFMAHGYDGPAFANPVGFQSPFTPGYMGMNQVPGMPMAQHHQDSLAKAQSFDAQEQLHPGQQEIAAAWEASFQEAMNEWVTTQNALDAETEATIQAEDANQEAIPEDTKDGPLNSSELARAAQQLVDAVSDNNSEKFRNSNFVDLMRRIAAQEIIVENNSLVEANSGGGTDDAHQAGDVASNDKGKGKAVAEPAYVEDAVSP